MIKINNQVWIILCRISRLTLKYSAIALPWLLLLSICIFWLQLKVYHAFRSIQEICPSTFSPFFWNKTLNMLGHCPSMVTVIVDMHFHVASKSTPYFQVDSEMFRATLYIVWENQPHGIFFSFCFSKDNRNLFTFEIWLFLYPYQSTTF